MRSTSSFSFAFFYIVAFSRRKVNKLTCKFQQKSQQPGAMFRPRLAFIQIGLQSQEPSGRSFGHQMQLAILVFCDLHKAIVVAEKMHLMAIRKHHLQDFPSLKNRFSTFTAKFGLMTHSRPLRIHFPEGCAAPVFQEVFRTLFSLTRNRGPLPPQDVVVIP